MSAPEERVGNASKPNLEEGEVCAEEASAARSCSTSQSLIALPTFGLQHDFYSANGNGVDDNYHDRFRDLYERWSPVDQFEPSSRKQTASPEATTRPPSSMRPITPPAQTKSTLTAGAPLAVESRRLRKRSRLTTRERSRLTTRERSRSTNRKRSRSTKINTLRHVQTETISPSRGRWPGLLHNTVHTILEVFRSPFFLPLCFILALSYLIAPFRGPLAEIIDTIRNAGRAIGSCLSFMWQNAGAWMDSAWNNTTPAAYQIMSTGAGVAISTMNKTNVAVCSHYLGWLVLTNLGLNCPYSTPYQPLDSSVDSTLNYATLGLGQIANSAVELLPYGRQLTFSEIWLRETSYKILETDLTDKVELAELYLNYTGQIAKVGEELAAFVSETDALVSFQRFNLAFLLGEIEKDEARIWWYRLFYPKESYIRHQYVEFIRVADEDLNRVYKLGQQCIDLVRTCQSTDGEIQRILLRNRKQISEEADDRGFLKSWLRRNGDLTQRTLTIDNMNEYLKPVLDLLGSILDRARDVRAELSTLENVLKHGHVGSTSPQLMVQMQTISSSIIRLKRARNDLRERRDKEEARHQQQYKNKLLRYEPLP